MTTVGEVGPCGSMMAHLNRTVRSVAERSARLRVSATGNLQKLQHREVRRPKGDIEGEGFQGNMSLS